VAIARSQVGRHNDGVRAGEQVVELAMNDPRMPLDLGAADQVEVGDPDAERGRPPGDRLPDRTEPDAPEVGAVELPADEFHAVSKPIPVGPAKRRGGVPRSDAPAGASTDACEGPGRVFFVKIS
jgi:hypothetical protein